MNSISAPFIARPIATTLLMLGIFLLGIVAYPLLPVAPLPQVDFPTIQVSATLPGASPETMASAVAAPLERQISQIPGVTQLTSSSALGATSITVQFDLDRNIDGAAQDIQAAITAAGGQLPRNLPGPPTYRKVNPADSPILLIAAQVKACRSPPYRTMPIRSSPSRFPKLPACRRSSSAANKNHRSVSSWTRPVSRIWDFPSKMCAQF